MTLKEKIKACSKVLFRGKPIHTMTVGVKVTRCDVCDREPVLGRWEWYVEQHGDPMYGVDEDFGWRCNRCHVWADDYGVAGDIYEEPPTHILRHCPNCGARMGRKVGNDD